MSALKKVIHELHYLKAEDIAQVFLFLLSLLPALVYKLYVRLSGKTVWLVCEDRMEARDNGYCFFRYLCEQHPEIPAYYAISPRSQDFQKVRETGKTVTFGSLMHWILYFAAEYNISSQKAGKPNAAVCYVLEVYGLIKSRAIFLQHGITINKGEWLFYENTKLRLFICGAQPEYDFIRECFGYPEEHLAYLGFSRFDDYHHIRTEPRQVVLMPSWREWIASKTEFSDKYEDTSDFTRTEYYQKYQELINSDELIDVLERYDLTLYFYPHRNMQPFIGHFSTRSPRIRIVSNKDADIRTLLTDSAVMITDYSSVALDFAYMKKPVIYYQFDEQRFREAQYAEGYYSYRDSGLGTVCESAGEVAGELRRIYENDRQPSERFEQAHRRFFPLYDDNNNERIFRALIGLSAKKEKT